jgi:hypothetical protein
MKNLALFMKIRRARSFAAARMTASERFSANLIAPLSPGHPYHLSALRLIYREMGLSRRDVYFAGVAAQLEPPQQNRGRDFLIIGGRENSPKAD